MKEKVEKLTRLIIEAIHDLPYDNALFQKEWRNDDTIDEETNYKEVKGTYRGFPITIGRVMQALARKTIKDRNIYMYDIARGSITVLDMPMYQFDEEWRNEVCFWQLTKENGQECTLKDQEEKTINKLLEIFLTKQ